MKRAAIVSVCFLIFGFRSEAQINCNDKKIASAQSILETLKYKPIVRTRAKAFVPGCNVTDSVKRRLLYLLHWEWSTIELNEYADRQIIAHKDMYKIDGRAKSVSKNNDSLYKIAADSIRDVVKKESLFTLEKTNKFRVDPYLIIAVGQAGIIEAVPFLRDTALVDPVHYDRWAIELALAKLGDKELQNKIIRECKYNASLNGDDWIKDFKEKFNKLAFLGTQESIYRLHEWIDTSKNYEATSNGGLGKCASFAISFMLPIFTDPIPKQKIKHIGLEGMNTMDMIDFKNWMKVNKGLYKIDPRFCPY